MIKHVFRLSGGYIGVMKVDVSCMKAIPVLYSWIDFIFPESLNNLPVNLFYFIRDGFLGHDYGYYTWCFKIPGQIGMGIVFTY